MGFYEQWLSWTSPLKILPNSSTSVLSSLTFPHQVSSLFPSFLIALRSKTSVFIKYKLENRSSVANFACLFCDLFGNTACRKRKSNNGSAKSVCILGSSQQQTCWRRRSYNKKSCWLPQFSSFFSQTCFGFLSLKFFFSTTPLSPSSSSSQLLKLLTLEKLFTKKQQTLLQKSMCKAREKFVATTFIII